MKLLWLLISYYVSFVYAITHVTVSNETFQDRSAAFGPRISSNGKIGYIIEPSEDPTGCSLVEMPCNDWIALIKRGGCSFITKVRNMQKSGAVAVIIGDPDSSNWITMYAPGDTSDILIPSLFITKYEYTKLQTLSKLFGNTPMMAILENNESIISWPLIDILLIVVLSPCIMLFLIYTSWKIKQGVKKRRELAPKSIVSKLNTKIYNEKNLVDPESCSICLEDYEMGDQLRLLPCNHQFHIVCVDAWLTTQKKLCPICKRDITMNNNNEITPLLLEEGY